MKDILKNKVYIIVIVIFLVLLVGIVILKNLSFKEFDNIMVYDYYNNRNRNLEIDIPMLSFSYKNSDQSIYLWNIRENKVLSKELDKLFLDKEIISCNGNEYYYDAKNDITIIDYKIKDYYFWNTIYYKYEFDNYCDRLKLEEANRIIDYGATYYNDINIDGIDYSILLFLKSNFNASFVIKKYNLDRSEVIEYENSKGIFSINNNKLIYTREKKNGKVSDIPITSEFIIQDKHTLIFNGDYLKDEFSKIFLNSDAK